MRLKSDIYFDCHFGGKEYWITNFETIAREKRKKKEKENQQTTANGEFRDMTKHFQPNCILQKTLVQAKEQA